MAGSARHGAGPGAAGVRTRARTLDATVGGFTVDGDIARRVLRNVGMATERLRRNRALDPDWRLRALSIVIH